MRSKETEDAANRKYSLERSGSQNRESERMKGKEEKGQKRHVVLIRNYDLQKYKIHNHLKIFIKKGIIFI